MFRRTIKNTSLGRGEFTKAFKRAVEDVRITSHTSVSRVLWLRPSSLPFCPLRFFLNYSQHGTVQSQDFFSRFFTKVGTVVHEVVQEIVGSSNSLLADWTCPKCNPEGHAYDPSKRVKLRKTAPKCKSCSSRMKYVEVEVDYNGVLGHVDAIWVEDDNTYWVVDFKTTSKSKTDSRKTPDNNYVEQIETYCYLLKKQYNMPIAGWILFYIVRDNPSNTQEFEQRLNKKDFIRIRNRLNMYKEQRDHAAEITKKRELFDLYENRACRVAEDVEKFGECKFAALCTGWKEDVAEDFLNHAFDSGKYIPIKSLGEKKR